MEKDREYRVISIIALIVAIVGLSVGFAAFTKDLNITFGESNVNINGELDIKFLASADPDDTSTVLNGIVGDTSGKYVASSVKPATISIDGTTISGIGGTFNNKDQLFSYSFYVYNNSEYDAYLKGIDFLNYTDSETYKVCTAINETTQSLVDDACKDIHTMIYVDDDSILDTNTNSFTFPKISKGEMKKVVVVVAYAGDSVNESYLGTSSSELLPDGDFKANFGNIKFSFSSLEG